MTTTAPPGPRGLPLLGNTHQWARDNLGFHERLAEYGRVVRYEALGDERYLLTEPEDIERVLSDPEQFRPDRWLDGSREDRPDFAYFPFGGGPRRCIGQQFAVTEAQLVLATLCSRWRFEREYDELDLSAAVTLKPKTDIEMTPRRR